MKRNFSKKVMVFFVVFLWTGISGNVIAQDLPVLMPEGSPVKPHPAQVRGR
jgi:hypothetical protein